MTGIPGRYKKLKEWHTNRSAPGNLFLKSVKDIIIIKIDGREYSEYFIASNIFDG